VPYVGKRQIMKERLIVIIIVLIATLFLIFTNFGEGDVRVYDCGMAEWHPDIPRDVKEECRRLRNEENRHRKESDESKSVLRA
jgi:hypothetical protein